MENLKCTKVEQIMYQIPINLPPVLIIINLWPILFFLLCPPPSIGLMQILDRSFHLYVCLGDKDLKII